MNDENDPLDTFSMMGFILAVVVGFFMVKAAHGVIWVLKLPYTAWRAWK